MRIHRLNDAENRVRQTTWAFADGRFEDPEVIEWAIALTPEQETERISLRELCDRQRRALREPYALAWRCIFEFWRAPQTQTAHDALLVRRELKQGGRLREAIKLIVNAVAPWLKVETARRFQSLAAERAPKRPRHLKHLLYASISSGKRLTPQDIGLAEIGDRDFLFELATGLNASLLAGLNLARMIGSISPRMDITNWQVHRVYFVPPAQFAQGGGEPDRYSDGFAPATKLMYAVTERLAAIDLAAARRIVASWDVGGWTLYRRLWAAAARVPELVSPNEVAGFLHKLDDKEFWIAGSYPEFAELRSVRWNTLSQADITLLERRLLKGEPARLIPSGVEKTEVQRYRKRHIVNEVRRIQAGGGNLSPKTLAWLEQTVAELEENLPEIDLTHGFNQGVRLITRDRTVAQSFDGIATSRLLDELAESLTEDGWDDKSENAAEYIAENASTVLKLLSGTPKPSVAIKIWQAFGYRFRPSDLNARSDNAAREDLDNIPIAVEACQALVNERPEVIKKAIVGLTAFMGNWDRLLAERDEFRRAWLTLWPYAVENTNNIKDHSSPLSDRAFSTPVGQMMWALVDMCPRIRTGENPMTEGMWPSILNAVAQAHGESKLEAQYVLVRDLGYFFVAAPDWASEHLIGPLTSSSSPDLWEAFGSGNLPQYELMATLAEAIVKATTSSELSGKVKADLAERVIWSILFDRTEARKPAISANLAQQMLRMGGDDVRSQVVRSLTEFLKRTDDDLDDLTRFELATGVFRDIWPKELTLSSRTVSEELAAFPAAAGAFYSEAADLILPYLTPFDCWSLWDYGFSDLNDSERKPKIIDDAVKAAAFLSILDKSVGGEEGAIIPHGLEDGLKHIALLAPKLEKDARFQRLVTLNRR